MNKVGLLLWSRAMIRDRAFSLGVLELGTADIQEGSECLRIRNVNENESCTEIV